MNQPDIIELLQELGFREIEAEVYKFLLQQSPATGYKVAKGIGRSFTNTYKAIEDLRTRGALLVEEGSSRLSRVVPIEELLDQMESRFQQNRVLAVAAANELPQAEGDQGIYHLTSLDQVYERFRQMLCECEQRALGELSPEPYSVLKDSIEGAGKLGRQISIRTYQGSSFEYARTVHSPIGKTTLAAMNSQWLSLFVDGRQFLIASLAKDSSQVLEAIWSSNMYLSRVFYSHVNADLLHYSFASILDSATSVQEIKAEYQRLDQEFPPGGDLGFKDMINAFNARTAAPQKTSREIDDA